MSRNDFHAEQNYAITSRVARCKESIEKKQKQLGSKYPVMAERGNTISFSIALDGAANDLITEMRDYGFSFYFIIDKLQMIGYDIHAKQDQIHIGID